MQSVQLEERAGSGLQAVDANPDPAKWNGFELIRIHTTALSITLQFTLLLCFRFSIFLLVFRSFLHVTENYIINVI